MLASKRCRKRNGNTSKAMPYISVVVPARNEEKNIINCIQSILTSEYPADRYEIVIVNDRSTDNTQHIVETIEKAHPNVRLCNITADNINPNLRGKPGAIQAGISISKGDIIMMTDADCIVGSQWISSIAKCFTDGVGMVCAYTNVKTKTIFHNFQAAEWAYMHTYACAGIGMDVVFGCFGNNISITREAYNTIGGYDNLKFSVTEDFVLLDAIHRAGYKIKYLCNTASVVKTLPVNTFYEYLIQRRRWSVGGMQLKWKAAAYVASSVALWLAIILSLIIGNYYLLTISILLRFLGDAFILSPVFRILDTRYLNKWIPLSVCFYSLVEVLLPFMMLSKTITWKDQQFKV
jgi:cellulose synthase/poly-beta-1,6-N-acetylglucosamine synthase-like glycosyltransferase